MVLPLQLNTQAKCIRCTVNENPAGLVYYYWHSFSYKMCLQYVQQVIVSTGTAALSIYLQQTVLHPSSNIY